jgi:hypothetical protein
MNVLYSTQCICLYCLSRVIQKGAGVQSGLGTVRIITASNECHLYRAVILTWET